ncbi:MAG: hypothetical protein ACYCU0_02285 [Solirubrobacteraceae bacterium]
MTINSHQTHLSPALASGTCQPSFASAEGLRALLRRLHAAGPGAWRQDSQASALLAYTIERYAPLARSWHRDPGEAGTAAFLALRNEGIRRAQDPWAVLTRAVQISLSAESHAERHLTSTAKARREQHAAREMPLRTGQLTATLTSATLVEAALETTGKDEDEPVTGQAILLMALLGWPRSVVAAVVEYVATRLEHAGSLSAAYETLRRDTGIRAQLDLERSAWTGLLGVLLGGRPRPGRPTRRGVLARLLLGESVRELLEDHELVDAVISCRPQRQLVRAGGGFNE